MCGLIAVSGKIESRYTIALGCLSEKRGDDSAGVGWSVGEAIRVAKIAQNPLVAFPVTLAPAIRHASKYGGALIGHTRQATTGAVTDKNAHPFYDKDSNIAWAHNGVISNYLTFGSYDVDSQCLIDGIKKKDFKGYSGPVALVWIEQGKLHAFRKGNPIYRGIRNRAVYLASEEDMLAQIGCKRIKELAEGQLYVWVDMHLETTRRIPSNTSYTSYRRTPYVSGYLGEYGEGGWDNMEWDAGLGKYIPKTVASHTDHRTCHNDCERRKVGFTVLPVPQEKSLLDESMCVACSVRPAMASSVYCWDCYDVIRSDFPHGGR